MIRHGWTDYIPGILFTILCARGLYTWRRNALWMKKNLGDLRGNGDGNDTDSILFARTDQLMDNLRAFAFLNGLVVGLLSLVVTYGASKAREPAWLLWAQNLTFLRFYGDYVQIVLIGAFAIFAFNGEIYSYVLDKVRGGRS